MRIRSLLASAVLAASALAAHADTIDYTITGGGNTYTFALNQNPSTNPGLSVSDPYAFVTVPVTVDENGVHQSERIQFATYDNPLSVFVFALVSTNAVYTTGNTSDVFFTGSTSDPTLLTGTFTFVNAPNGETYTLTATDATLVATPEPSSIALLGTGVLGTAGLLRRRYMGA